MNNHPALTRLLLVAGPAVTFGVLFVFDIGAALTLAALALGGAILLVRSRSLTAAFRGPLHGPWWAAPLMGLGLIGVGLVLTALPGPGELRWALATLLGLVGMVIVVASLLLSVVVRFLSSPAD